MTEFTVHLANRPGQLATLARRLADAGVHIEAFAAFATGEEGVVRLMADNEDAARRVLEEAGLVYDEHRVIATVVPNRPGALALRRSSRSGFIICCRPAQQIRPALLGSLTG